MDHSKKDFWRFCSYCLSVVPIILYFFVELRVNNLCFFTGFVLLLLAFCVSKTDYFFVPFGFFGKSLFFICFVLGLLLISVAITNVM